MKLSKLLASAKEDRPLTKAWEKARIKGLLDSKSDHDDGAYHPSALAGCPAMLFLQMEKFPIPKENIDGPKHRVFLNGDYFHERMQVELCKAGVLDVSALDQTLETPIHLPKYNIRGHCDGVLNFGPRERDGSFIMHGRKVPRYKFSESSKRAVLELKSIKGDDDKNKSRQYGFNAVQRNGVKDDHYLQANIYAKALGLERIVFLYENKNTHFWYEEVLPFSKELWLKVVNKIKMIEEWRAEFKKTGKIPKEVYKIANESAKTQFFGIKARDLLIRRMGEKSLEQQRLEALKCE